MATLSNAARSAGCNAITALINGDFRLLTGASAVLATISLNAGASGGFDSAVNGVAALDVAPALSAVASGSGTAALFELRSGAAANVITGTIGTGAEDLDIDGTSISAGQTINLNAITVTVPAS